MTRTRLVVWLCAAGVGLTSVGTSAGEFKRVEEFPQGMQTDVWTSAFLSGFELSNAVERTFPASFSKLWVAAKRVAERLETVGRRSLVGADERTGRIQNGKISQDASLGAGSGGWLDEIMTEVTALAADSATKVVVSRRVVQTVLKRQRSGYDRQWRTSKSNGQIENWVLTQIENELAALSTTPASPEAVQAKPEPRPSSDIEAQLQRLQELKDKKLISEDEYQSMRKRVLESLLAPPSSPPKQ